MQYATRNISMSRTFFYPNQLLTPRHLAHLHDSLHAALRQIRLAMGTGVIFYGFEVKVEGNQLIVTPGLGFDGEGQPILLEGPLVLPFPIESDPLILCLRYHALVDEIDNEGRPLRERDSITITWLASPPRDENLLPLARVQRTAQGWMIDGTIARRAAPLAHRHTGEVQEDRRGRLRYDGAPLVGGGGGEWQSALQKVDRTLSQQINVLRQLLGEWQSQLQLQALEVEELRGEVGEISEGVRSGRGGGDWQEVVANLREEFALFAGDDLRDDLEQLRAEVATLALRPPLPASNAGTFTPITALHGVGSSFAGKLNAAGITTVSDFLAAVASPDARNRLLATDISPARLRRWSREADLLRLHGCGTNEVMLLDSAGITGTASLATEDPRNLYERLRATAQQRGDMPPPAYAWVESWVAQAQHLPPVVEW
jgi:predicted flap endonuclease-1-like 5' DNA nuclease